MKKKVGGQLFLFGDGKGAVPISEKLKNVRAEKRKEKEEKEIPVRKSGKVYFILEGGVHEIGGNKLFIEDGDLRIGIDFGHSYSIENLYYNRPISRPPTWNPLPILSTLRREVKNQELYFLPDPKIYVGLYRSDLIEMAKAEGYYFPHGDPYLAALFISHPHFDHYGSVCYLNEKTEIYSGEISYNLIKCIEEMARETITKINTKIATENEVERIKEINEKLKEIFGIVGELKDEKQIKTLIERKIREDKKTKEIITKITSGIAGVVSSVAKKNKEIDDELKKKLISGLSAIANEIIVKHIGSPAFEAISPIEENLRKWKFFKDCEEIKIGNFKVIPLEVSHQIVGSFGFLVETPRGTIGYLSDFRRHGQNREKTEEAIKKMKGVDYLFVEFTRAHEDFNFSEESVREKILEAMKRSQGITIVDVPISNTWELFFQYEIAKECGKKICITPKFAHILNAINGNYGFPLPDDENILILKKQTSEGTFEPTRSWISPYYAQKNSVTPEYVRKNQDEIVLIGGYSMVNTIFSSIRPKPKSIYIRPFRTGAETSEAELPFELQAERLASLQRMEKWLRTYKLLWEEKDVYISGHASFSDVIKTVKEINPKYVIPIHTEHPEYFEMQFINEKIKVINPIRGEKYEIK